MSYSQDVRAIRRQRYFQRCRIRFHGSCGVQKLLLLDPVRRGEAGSGLRSILDSEIFSLTVAIPISHRALIRQEYL